MKLQMSLRRTGCVQDRYMVKAKGYSMAIPVDATHVHARCIIVNSTYSEDMMAESAIMSTMVRYALIK